MLRAPDGTPIVKLDQEEAKHDTLRGQKINEINQDLNDEDLSQKEKVLKYSSHLSWFMEKFELLQGAQEKAQQEGVFNISVHTVGIANGLILATAIFLEEQGSPPTRKIPNDLKHRENEILTEQIKGFIITMMNQLEAVLCIDQETNYPKGYEKYDSINEAYAQWHTDTVHHLSNCPVSFPELQAAINRIGEYHRKNIEKEGE